VRSTLTKGINKNIDDLALQKKIVCSKQTPPINICPLKKTGFFAWGKKKSAKHISKRMKGSTFWGSFVFPLDFFVGKCQSVRQG
jgi:hypothetical protein